MWGRMRLSVWMALSLLAIFLGVVFYLYMGLTYGNWGDVGVYTLAIVSIGFGVFGALAATWRPQPEEG